MGKLSSAENWSGREVAGIVLGNPATDERGLYVWEHPSIPTGRIDAAGGIVMAKVGSLIAPALAPTKAPATADEVAAGIVEFVDGRPVDSKGGAVSLELPADTIKRLDSPA